MRDGTRAFNRRTATRFDLENNFANFSSFKLQVYLLMPFNTFKNYKPHKITVDSIKCEKAQYKLQELIQLRAFSTML